MKKIYLLMAFLIIFIPLISSQPPFQQELRFIDGYDISIPQIGILKQDTNFTFAFHVYNLSNGVPIDNSTTSCSFHLFDNLGEHLFADNNMNNTNAHGLTNDWETIVLGGNFSRLGDYAYLLQCNSTTDNLGGFQSVMFEITPSGNSTVTVGQGFLILGQFLLFIGTFLGLIIIGITIKNIPVKLFLFSLSALLLMTSYGFSSSLQTLVGYTSGGFWSDLYILFTILILGGLIGLIVYFVAFVLTLFSKSRGFIDNDDDE